MALIEREILAAMGVTALVASPKARGIAHKGAVYGLAGALTLGDAVVTTARGAARGASRGMQGPSDGAAGGRARPSQSPGTRHAPAKSVPAE